LIRRYGLDPEKMGGRGMAEEGSLLLPKQMLEVEHQDHQVQIEELVVVIQAVPRWPMKTFVRW